MKPVISVVMPVFNNCKGFHVAIKSVMALNSTSLEIIVIDGGSSDGTVEAIAEYADKIAYWESGKDKGIADAFNRGIARASGEFIAILNSDDYWESDTFHYFISAYKEYPYGDVFYGAIRYIDKKRNYSYVRFPSLKKMKYRMSLFHPAMFVKRDCYLGIGDYKLTYTHAMDSEWCHRAIAKEKKFCEIPAVLANMSLGGLSDRDYAISLAQYRESLIENNICGNTEARIYYYFNIGLKRIMQNRFLYGLKRCRDRFIAKK